jgi:hypothetical protein
MRRLWLLVALVVAAVVVSGALGADPNLPQTCLQPPNPPPPLPYLTAKALQMQGFR